MSPAEHLEAARDHATDLARQYVFLCGPLNKIESDAWNHSHGSAAYTLLEATNRAREVAYHARCVLESLESFGRPIDKPEEEV